MLTLDDIRRNGERDIEEVLSRLDRRHRALIEAAILEYGSVAAVPESVWQQVEREQEEEVAAAILLLLLSADEWAEDELRRQGVRGTSSRSDTGYALDAARRSRTLAAQTTATLRDRLARKVQDAALTGPGSTGTLTQSGIRSAIDQVFTPERRATISVDTTTTAISRGQISATRRIVGPDGTAVSTGGQPGDSPSSAAAGGDGAAVVAGQRVRVDLLWQIRDGDACPRCAPLNGQPESVWGLVFPEGPGPDAHPNCRCSLRPQVVVDAQ